MDLKQQAPAATPSLLTVSPSPHARRKMTTTSVMKDVLIALLPTTAWGIYIYGLRAALVVLLAVGFAFVGIANFTSTGICDCLVAR